MRLDFVLVFLNLIWSGAHGKSGIEGSVHARRYEMQAENGYQNMTPITRITGEELTWSETKVGTVSKMVDAEHWANNMTEMADIARFEMNRTNGTKPPPIRCDVGWQIYVKMVCVPGLALFGATGNILSFFVMGSPMYRGRSYGCYLRALAIFDTLTLFTFCVLTGNEIAAKFGSGGFLHFHTSFTCKMSDFLKNVIYLMSSWVIVAFTCDRYIAVCHPLQRARLCTETRAKAVIFILFMVAMATQTFRFYYMEKLDRLQPCHAALNRRIVYFGIHYFWFSFLLRFALPFVIIVVCNGRIIFHVHRMRKVRHTEERVKKRQAHLAITTLIVVCAVFVVTLIPNAIIALIQFIEMVVYRRHTLFCTLLTLDIPLQMIRLLNYSTNFIMYGLTGRLFRRELCRLLSCRPHGGNTSSNQKVAVKVNFQLMQRRPQHFPSLIHQRTERHNRNSPNANATPFLGDKVDNNSASDLKSHDH